MKKTFLIVFLVGIVLFGCKKEQNNPVKIKNQIVAYKMQIEELNAKIIKLESSLGEDTLINSLVKVEFVTVKTQKLERSIDITANVDAENNAMISPEMNGQITKIYVKEGQQVSKGQVLAKLNDEVLKNNLAQLQSSLLFADTMYQKQKKLYEQKIVSEVQYLQAKNQKETLEKNIDVIKSQIALSTIKAPFSGIVDRIYFKEGEIAAPGRAVFQIVNLTTMIATADISEKYLPKIKLGDVVKLNFPTYSDIEISSKIYQIGNVIDPTNRTFRIKIMFNNVQNKIKPNMLSVIQLVDYSSDNAIVLPSNCLIQDIAGWYVYIIEQKDNKNFARKKYVDVGVSTQNETEILNGLNEGDKIITKGYNQVKDGLEINL